MINECFGVGVVSGAMDGVAPKLNPGRVHRRINTHPEVRYVANMLLEKLEKCMHMLQFTSITFPSAKHPASIRTLRHPWLRLS